jgi:hypothetical protein
MTRRDKDIAERHKAQSGRKLLAASSLYYDADYWREARRE